MEHDRFDDLTARLAAPLSRRRSVGLLGLLGVSTLLTADHADAKKKKKKKKKKNKNKNKQKTCASCPPCQQCQQGACVAVADQTPCGGGKVCDAGACRAERCGDPGVDCLVFISSTEHTGKLGGLAGADAICQNLAADAGIPGTYMAWLSDSTSSPSTRFPTKSASPYKLLNGVKIADNWADLTDGQLQTLFTVTDAGPELPSGPGQHAWTATLPTGQKSGPTCNNWTTESTDVSGLTGYHRHATQSTGRWTSYDNRQCNAELHLYCVQQA